MLHTGTFDLGFLRGAWYLFNNNTIIAVFVNCSTDNVQRIHSAVRAYVGPLAGVNIMNEEEIEKRLPRQILSDQVGELKIESI